VSVFTYPIGLVVGDTDAAFQGRRLLMTKEDEWKGITNAEVIVDEAVTSKRTFLTLR